MIRLSPSTVRRGGSPSHYPSKEGDAVFKKREVPLSRSRKALSSVFWLRKKSPDKGEGEKPLILLKRGL